MNPIAALAQLLPPAGPASATGRAASGATLGGDRTGAGDGKPAAFDFTALLEADPEAVQALGRELNVDLGADGLDPDAMLKALLTALAIGEETAGGSADGDAAPLLPDDAEALLAAMLEGRTPEDEAADDEPTEDDGDAAAPSGEAVAGPVEGDGEAVVSASDQAPAAAPNGGADAATVVEDGVAAGTGAANADGAEIAAQPLADRTAGKTATAADAKRPEHLQAAGFVGAAAAVKQAQGDARNGQTAQVDPAAQTGRDAGAAIRAAAEGGRGGAPGGEERPLPGQTATTTATPTAVAAGGAERPAGTSFQSTLDGMRQPTPQPTEQVTVQLRQAVANGANHVTIRLQPASLGHVEVRLEIADDRLIQARVVVDKSETLDMLRRDSGQLERALSNAGLQTDSGGLNFSLRGQQHGHAFGQQHGNGGQPGAAENPDAADDDLYLADIRDFGVRPNGWTADGRLDLTI